MGRRDEGRRTSNADTPPFPSRMTAPGRQVRGGVATGVKITTGKYAGHASALWRATCTRGPWTTRANSPMATTFRSFFGLSENMTGAVHWKPYSAVHHLLTGGGISPAAIQATTRYRIGQKVFGETHHMSLEISDKLHD